MSEISDLSAPEYYGDLMATFRQKTTRVNDGEDALIGFIRRHHKCKDALIIDALLREGKNIDDEQVCIIT